MTGVIRTEFATCESWRLSNQSYNDQGCSVSFDKSLCWMKASYGEHVTRDCPFTYCTSIPGCEQIPYRFKVGRSCNRTGLWDDSDYSMCLTVLEQYSKCIQGFCRVCPDFLREVVISVSLTLSIVSVALLVAAIILFSIFDSIQCRRLSIHKSLATAFVFRFAVLAIWTIVQSTNLFQDCTQFHPQPLWKFEWICKTILWFVIYFQVASVMWMLIEGAYLYSRFTIYAMRNWDTNWYLYMLCGWGVPFVVVMCWTVVHQAKVSGNRNSFCWVPYAQGSDLWILAGTMGFALIMNLVFLLAIVEILVRKLRTERGTAESKKIWRTIKATLLLVPLLGISNIPLFYEPEQPSAVYMLGSAILQHSQGIFIAVLYCFLNSEIQNAVKRQLSKVPIEFFKPRQRYETERTYVPENRNTHPKNGVPMEELNGKHAVSETTPLNNSAEKLTQQKSGEGIFSVSGPPIRQADSL
ncbi:unnamed protein product [Caenorhabditis auriculariae]|uniref:G-protein coupled receptors family 2 profile 2 domain-containing protein n=1 Tax=Caenorhabditis auriculariae TaxID=2777116 RepID=A0A8S1GZ06_9PELO|nr:unnamed protein product [Caenorhabditis auriculariae]